jgi:protein-tyrosine phosphatase
VAPDVVAQTREVYLIFLERFRPNVAAGIRAVARAPAGGVVFHCVGGKDRTGLLCAFLLHLAGVGIEDIAADYALSEERLQPRLAAWLAEAETEAEREWVRRVSRTPAESMVEVFAELESRYGGVTEYLRGAGLEDEDLELAAARLR